MKFDARIDGSAIRCSVTSDRDLTSPVFCYSLMAPSVSKDGFPRLKSVGGYTELQLPALSSGEILEFTVAYENPEFMPANRAWLPLGAFLRDCEGIHPLPLLEPAGVLRGSISYADGVDPTLKVCPQPTSFEPANEVARVSALKADSSDQRRALELANRCGLGDYGADNGIPVTCELDRSLGKEAYRIEIATDSIQVFHASDTGAFYAGVTLVTLLATHDSVLPCGVIADTPRFEWRGQHLDCARHFYGVETILKLLDLMALLKMNRFHWHFADDEAFRLELDSLPELARTHFRGENQLLPGVFGGGARAGGSYSKVDAKRVIDHAKSLGIEVMPEIEVPAHALALCKLYPETRDRRENGAEQSVQGYLQNVMNPALPESWRIWEAMVTEISDLFPFDTLHLGGDELPHDTWSGSPAARELMQTEGLATTQDLQGWTMNKLARHTIACGKTPAGWEESALGTPSIENDAVIFSWTGQGPGLQAARDGHRIVMMPGQKTYLDMAQTESPNDWGANWAAIISLEETLNWEPVPTDEPELEEFIIGVEGAFWSEFTTEDSEMEPMLAPRILGIASMAWQSQQATLTDVLLGLRRAYARVFDAMNWQQS